MTCDEWRQYAERVFAAADQNADRFLDFYEFQLLRVGESAAFSSADMSFFDDNRDQRISRKEFVEKPSPFFLRYDLDKNCRVTRDEIAGAGTPPRKDKGPPGMGGPSGGMGKGKF